MWCRIVFVGVALFFALPYKLWAQQTIYIVRHAENVRNELKREGKDRAIRLAEMLKDSGITAILTSTEGRTVKTAEPLAQPLGIKSKPVSQIGIPPRETDIAAFVKNVRRGHPVDVVLIVSQSDTIPELFDKLGHPNNLSVTDHGDLFVLKRKAEGKPDFDHKRY